MKLTKSELKELIRECLQEELRASNLQEGRFGDVVKGMFSNNKNEDEPIYSLKKQKEAQAVINKLARELSRQQHGDVVFNDYDLTAANEKFSPQSGFTPNSGYAIGLLKIECGKDVGVNSLSYLSRRSITSIAKAFEQAIRSSRTAVINNMMIDRRLDIEQEYAGTVIFFEIEMFGSEEFEEELTANKKFTEAATGFRLTASAMLSIEDLADAVYRDNDPDAITKYASVEELKDVTADDLRIAAENSDIPREVKYLAAHLKNSGVNTIGEFAAKLNGAATNEALNEDVNTMDWDTLIDKADEFLYELIKVSGNADYDDADGYWSGEEGHIWTNRYLYYTDKLNDSTRLEKLCDEYSRKLPDVAFYYTEDDFLDDPISEIGYEATNVNW